MRHNEGTRIASLQKHTSAVSVLSLADDERTVLSGSWDKTIADWDLNTGQVVRTFDGSGGQISAIERRPESNLPVPEEVASSRPAPNSSTFSSNNASRPSTNGALNGAGGDESRDDRLADGLPNGEDGPGGSPSLNSLFGDEDDEFSRAIANGIQVNEDEDGEGDANMQDAGGPVQPPTQGDATDQLEPASRSNAQQAVEASAPASDGNPSDEQKKAPEPEAWSHGLPHSEELHPGPKRSDSAASRGTSSVNTFLDAAIDGTIRIWDKRQHNPIARILPSQGVPPWCMNACWSPDGNFIFAGRRNNTVEEYSLVNGLKAPSRTFKFPYGSGAVSAVKAMPNGRHLVW